MFAAAVPLVLSAYSARDPQAQVILSARGWLEVAGGALVIGLWDAYHKKWLETRRRLLVEHDPNKHPACSTPDITVNDAERHHIFRVAITNSSLSPTIHGMRAELTRFIPQDGLPGELQLMNNVDNTLNPGQTKFADVISRKMTASQDDEIRIWYTTANLWPWIPAKRYLFTIRVTGNDVPPCQKVFRGGVTVANQFFFAEGADVEDETVV